MATTTNYSWSTPDDTALVKDGAAAIRTLGSSIDTTTKALNPSTTLGDIEYRSATANTNTRLPIGTSGQVLAVVGGVPAWATTADQTPLTTKGDLFTFDTADARLGVGANGTVLTADSAETTGMKWAALAAGGKLLQVVQGSLTSEASTTSNSAVDTGLSVTITPTLNTSKVLLFVVHNAIRTGGGNNADGAYFRLLRASTSICTFAALVGYTNSLLRQDGQTASVMFLDTPATTSATTYKTQFYSEVSGNAVYTNSRSPSFSTIVAFEIGA